MVKKESEGPGSRYLSRAKVAEIFQVAPSTVTRWAEAGKLPSMKTLGGHRRYEARVVMELAHQFSEAQEAVMEKCVIEAPAMYGDHHVLEVRRLLLALPGVEEVYASSCFQAIEVDYTPDKVTAEEILTVLDRAGYLGDMHVPVETGIAVSQDAEQDRQIFYRHTTALEEAKNVVSFGQKVNYTGRPLWSCPGVGVINQAEVGR
jgi:copper chaperone CopZ